MAVDRKPPRLIFPGECDVHRALFERRPLAIVEMYLQSFDEEGRQVFEVPQHVLEALAERFGALMAKRCNGLDEAFGGRVAQQRNALLRDRDDYTVLWDLVGELGTVRGEPIAERGAGTAFEIAVERVAAKHDMSPDNVRRIYKKSGSR